MKLYACPFVDNITYFKHLRYPKSIISEPSYIIKVLSKVSGNTYYYGCYTKPNLEEIRNYLKDYMYALDEYELFNFKETNFKITITEKLKHEKTERN